MSSRKRRKIYNFLNTNKEKLENGKINTNRTNFIDSFTFMSSSLSSLVDNLSEGLHNLDNLSEGLALNTISLRKIS